MAAMMDMDDTSQLGRILVDQWEWREGDGARSGVWDVEGWYGGDYNKLLLRSEGDWPSAGAQGRAELLWDRIVTRWWSLQGGVRYDLGAGPGKGWAALGVRGWRPTGSTSRQPVYRHCRQCGDTLQGGDRSALHAAPDPAARARAQRLCKARPCAPAGGGPVALDAGLRLRYEIRRELAPYLGLAWLQRWGESAQSLRDSGVAGGQLQWLLGVRYWY